MMITVYATKIVTQIDYFVLSKTLLNVLYDFGNWMPNKHTNKLE